MRKLIAAINITIDGFCDHTAGIANEELLQHYTNLLRNADSILYGRIAFQLMKYWQTVLKNPTGNKVMDEFAETIDNIPKIVFSRMLKNVDWKSAKLANQGIEEEVLQLKQSGNGGSEDILVGSPGLIVSLTELHLMDKYQLCVHPVIAGNGLPLFKNLNERTILKFIKTKTLDCGAVILYYEPAKMTAKMKFRANGRRITRKCKPVCFTSDVSLFDVHHSPLPAIFAA